MNNSIVKRYQYNPDFERLLDEKLDIMEADYHQAQTAAEKEEVLRSHGFDLDDFYRTAIQTTNLRMLKLEVNAHAQRTADFLFQKRRTIYRYL